MRIFYAFLDKILLNTTKTITLVGDVMIRSTPS